MGKKILILVNHDIVIYNFRRELVEHLLKKGFDVVISSPYGKRIDFMIELGVKYVETKINRHGINPIQDFFLYRTYLKLINDENPDFVLTYTIKPNIYGGLAAKRRKVKYISNITGLGTALEKKSILQLILLKLYRMAFKDVHTVFVQNTSNLKFMKQHNIAINKLSLIPGSGVNLTHFNLLPYPNDKEIDFVFISRIMKRKGIEQYLFAAEKMVFDYPNVRFHICGFLEEDYKEKINNLVENKVVIYHGLIDDVKSILSKTHCTVFPSFYPEGISNVLLESAACGRPIITTNRSGCKEVVENGITGFLIEAENSEDLVSKMQSFITLSYQGKKEMGIRGRKKVESEFDREIVIKEYMRCIEGVRSNEL